MASIRYALLTLLAREPLSGYDIKQHMNNRIGPFWKVGSNQVYPELSKMEEEGLVRLQGVEQNSYRPARKVYEITESGRDELIRWTVEPGGVENTRDDFLLKVYNTWLVEPSRMAAQVREVKKQHEQRLSYYLDKVAELENMLPDSRSGAFDPIASTIPVVEFGIEHERLYIDWCDRFIAKLTGK
ncbi:PadR family transcriptional regulator [Paenibacillus thermotolerans]|uniref:PadR family transcriptional regulator n=1 Tax=Paenibacillus thermotolerans TaxID=3027807 RepID=UPI002367DDDD|nr:MULTISPECIES: PadR family transcriptional regulator [unclassified Paenibacillus]